jgi:hypothetical protein
MYFLQVEKAGRIGNCTRHQFVFLNSVKQRYGRFIGSPLSVSVKTLYIHGHLNVLLHW